MMKAVILAAGPSPLDCGFLPNAKPKCLYRFRGEGIILEENIRILNECGIQEIRIIVGYQAKMIERFVQDKNLKVELVWNEKWKSDAMHSLILGMKNIDEDVLCLEADNLLRANIVRQFLNVSDPLACIQVEKPWGEGIDEYYRGDLSFYLCKIGVLVLPYVKNVYQYFEKYKQRYAKWFGACSQGSGIAIGLAMRGIFYDNDYSIGYVSVPEHYPDLDYYWETDDYKESSDLQQKMVQFTHYSLMRLLAAQHKIKHTLNEAKK